jgi:elongation factor G
MKPYPMDRIRNVAVVGHGGTGKTTLVEALLFTARAIDRLGSVEAGTTTTDFDPEEVRRRHTINAALAPLEWREHKITLIDTPGYPDFIGEVVGSLRVCEGALVVVDGVAGVEVQTEKVWQAAADQGVARLVVVNRIDRENASFERAVESLRARFGGGVVPLHLPIGAESALRGLVDLVALRAYTWRDGEVREEDVPPELREEVERARERLIEAAAEADDALVETYLEQGTLSDEEVRRGLVAGVRRGALIPVLAAAGGRLIGAGPLLDAIVALLPSPAAIPEVRGTRPGSEEMVTRPATSDAPLAALVFKTMADPYVGKLSYFRVYAGRLSSDSQVLNATRQKVERVGTLFFLRGKHQEPTGEVAAGDIGAVAKLAETVTGDTLSARDAPIVLPPVRFPRPAMTLAIEPRSRGDEDKLAAAIHRLAEEDPTIRVYRDPELRQTLIAGMGESHIEIIADRLRRKFGVAVTLAPPRVPYRETVRRRVTGVQGRYVKQTGGRGQYGVCVIDVEPLPRGGGYEFVDKIFGGAIPNQFIPSVDKGVRKAMEEGVLAGYPVVDVRVTLVDGKYHPVDSSDIAFQIAGSLAFKEAAQQAGVVLLEPIMTLAVRIPEELLGDIMGDLNARRARITGMESQGDGTTVVRAQVPQAEILRYASDLRSMTGGRGTFEVEFSHYEEVPAHVAERVVAEAKQQKAAAASH